MFFLTLQSKRLNEEVRKQLKAGQLDEESVIRIAEELVREHKAGQQAEDLRTKRLKMGLPILFILVLLMKVANFLQTGSSSAGTLVILIVLVIGAVVLFRWLDRLYLREFVAATRRHYPELSARYAEEFFKKKQK